MNYKINKLNRLLATDGWYKDGDTLCNIKGTSRKFRVRVNVIRNTFPRVTLISEIMSL